MSHQLRNYGHPDVPNDGDPYCDTGYIDNQGAYILGDY